MTEKSRKKSTEEPEETLTKEEPKKSKEQLKVDELTLAKADAEKYLDMARRLQADFDNYRKRTQKETEEFRKFATEGMAKELLTIVDDMDRALNTVKEETEFVKGIRGIRQNLMKVLEEYGLTEIPTDGKFDPNIHEALCVTEGDADDTIAEVFQKGYHMNGRVLRYSKVRVTKKKEE
ncbi:MAG: nucleotide exchange factor GrpE [Candidatus Methanomethylophilaceae archaeon]|nr:nucleotide exchange factor GrpE [Candidatus Methanomethylophilaceae archaeon]MDD3378968.1 nucleotide exchange factor GrpE [Candidatus Methanomethylophilaceae archaeon]MDY0224637.1 nucleotide exchange factor GrpE [Candidatus Methanomethylophilaceae archaeon]